MWYRQNKQIPTLIWLHYVYVLHGVLHIINKYMINCITLYVDSIKEMSTSKSG